MPLRTVYTLLQSCTPRWAGRSGTELSAPPESEDGVGGFREGEIGGSGREGGEGKLR